MSERCIFLFNHFELMILQLDPPKGFPFELLKNLWWDFDILEKLDPKNGNWFNPGLWDGWLCCKYHWSRWFTCKYHRFVGRWFSGGPADERFHGRCQKHLQCGQTEGLVAICQGLRLRLVGSFGAWRVTRVGFTACRWCHHFFHGVKDFGWLDPFRRYWEHFCEKKKGGEFSTWIPGSLAGMFHDVSG